MSEKNTIINTKTLSELQRAVKEISTLTQKYEPHHLLSRALREYSIKKLANTNIYEPDLKDRVLLLTLEFVQNNYASLKKDRKTYEGLSCEAWKEIIDKIESIDALPATLLEGDKLISHAITRTWYVRNSSFAEDAFMMLTYLLKPHDDIFNEVFEISTGDFMEGVKKIWGSWLTGIINARNISDEMINLDLCDIGNMVDFPNNLLDCLSWKQGGDEEYWASGKLSGIPLGFAPINKRPFLHLNGRYYCVSASQFIEIAYRSIERSISKLMPDYKWEILQKEASESLALEIIKPIFPNAQFCRSVYFGGKRKSKKYETDIIAIYDETFFIVEVKAVAGFFGNLVENPKNYQKKLEEMIRKPIDQASKLLSYINSGETLNLYDGKSKKSNLVLEIEQDSFNDIVLFGVSVDNISDIGSHAGQLKSIGVDVEKNIISISMADLIIYARVFENEPIRFLHYISKRREALSYEKLVVPDEIEYLGFYIKANNCIDVIKAMLKVGQENFVLASGLDTEIHDFYIEMAQLEDPSTARRPSQKIPSEILNIMKNAETNDVLGHVRACKALLDGSSKFRNDFCNQIKKAISMNKKGEPHKLALAIGEGDIDKVFFIYCSFPSSHNKIVDRKLRFIGEYAILMWQKKREGVAFELHFDNNYSLFEVAFDFFDIKDLEKVPPEEREKFRKEIKFQAKQMKARHRK